MQNRMGWVTRLHASRVQEYRQLHLEPWPEIVALLSAAGVTDYTIWLYEPELLLFSSFVYTGIDFQSDMAKVTTNPIGKRWHTITAACQVTLGIDGAPWALLTEIFRLD